MRIGYIFTNTDVAWIPSGAELSIRGKARHAIQGDGCMKLDTRELRKTLGCFATGVTIVTTAPEGHDPIGITANSFASVSLEPPLVLWSLARHSSSYETFAIATHYTVNILRESQVALSVRFADPDNHRLLNGLSWRYGENGCPTIPGSLATLECEIRTRIDGGDHVILLGRVLRFEQGEGKPLLFAQGKYANLA